MGSVAAAIARPLGSIVGGVMEGAGLGNSYQATPAQISSPVTKEQIDAANLQAQNTLAQQQAFVNALQSQGGLQNQSNVFNQLQNIAQGQGPNPAQAMLNQATGANVANQAALMAGQRGASANVGLIGRQAAQQGAATQQQAASQAANLQAQQSLGALNQAGNIANTQAQQALAGTNALTGAAQGLQSNLLGAQGSFNAAQVNNQAEANRINSQVAANNAATRGQLFGQLTSAIGTGISGIPMGGGGGGGKAMAGGTDLNQKYAMMAAEGGEVKPTPKPKNKFKDTGKGVQDTSGYAAYKNKSPTIIDQIKGFFFEDDAQKKAEGGMIEGPRSHLGRCYANGGNVPEKVPALLSPGETYLAPNEVSKVKQGADPMKIGEKIPGKPKVPGPVDSYANDTVPKVLKEGGIVLPRSVTQAKDPSKKAAEFVAAILKDRALKK